MYGTTQGTYVPRRVKHRRVHVGRIVLGCLLIIMVTVAGAGLGLASKFGRAFEKTTTIASAFPDEDDRPVKDPGDTSMNILLLGADGGPGKGKRAAIDPNATATDRRSDSMMLVHIPESRDKVYVISLMRDTWISIPGHGEAKLNAAMANGGVPLLIQTLEERLGTRIDHVAIIDFQGFRDLTTAIGGVTVDNEYDFIAHDTDYHYPKGKIHIDGDKALRFVRERKSFPDGDYQRVRNQQKFLKAVFGKVLSAETLSNPAKLFKVVDSIAPYISMDEEFSDPSLLTGLGLQMKNVRASDIVSFTLPTAGTGTSLDGQSIVLPDQAAIDALAEALRNDTVADYYAALPEEKKK
ncbi:MULTISPECIES: LCP family protein [Micrococcaceae]|uniref:LCP family protein n=1 Tax=Micrococcaceae TaxID=1268 RepID=UPI0005587CC8|nr:MULTISPECIES: LCP family protein [Micrococcaceae]OFT24208.1 hypothetical protein HMPREF3175_01555 [Arthrobacter sp. HMSC08H08]OFT43347.1 hypothetical protein HMPREF3160_02835 [Arthrobacter sp. HMSC06H05]